MADSLVRLRIDSNEFDAKLKTASQNLQSYFDKVKQGAGTFEYLDDGVLDCAKALGQLSTKSNTARGSISELTSSFTEWSLRYKQMTEAEKNTPLGREIKNSLDQLKTRIQDTKNDLAAINQELSGSKFGQFGGVIDTIGHKMGVSANLTELLTSKTALMTAGIGAAVAAIYKGSEAWSRYNSELAKQDQQTTVITGLRGTAADHMTDTMRALSDTYKVDFRQAVEAANTLMTQFGASGDEAIKLIKDGMQGMIAGDGQKMLSMIQQYAPAFHDAGVSASQLVAIIHNTEGGIFTDQNMNAIVMGIKNIRLMTKQTRDALAQLGIDGKKMSQDLNDGTLTVFDALKQVATKLKDCEAGSQEAGQVMQTVFGRQGAMAGTNLAKAIETLNTNLEETKKQTGELGDAFAELQTAYEKLNTSIREAFSYDGWEQMATGIRASLISTLADVIDKLGQIKGILVGLTPGQARMNRYGTSGTPAELERDLKALQEADEKSREDMYRQMLAKYEKRYNAAASSLNKAQTGYDTNENSSNWQGVPFVRKALDRHYWSTKVNTASSNVLVESEVLAAFRNGANSILNPIAQTHPKGGGGSGGGGGVATTAKEFNPMQQAQKEISALTEEALTADEARLEIIKKEIAALQEQVNVYKSIQDFVQGKEPNWNIQVGDRKAFEAEQKKIFEANGGTASRLESMQYSVMKEIKAEDVKVDTETLHTLLKDALQNSIDTTSLDLTSIANQIGEGINVPDETWQAIIDRYNKLKAAIGKEPININLKSGEEAAEDGKAAAVSWKDAAKAVNTMGSALSHIPDPAAKIASTVAMSIANVAMAYSDALAKDVGSKFNIFGFIAAAAASMVSMATTIASIHSATGYAQGGIIEGNSYSGDNIGGIVDGSQFVGLNAGELVLTRAMQNNLASQLSETRGGGGGTQGIPYVTGDKIVLGINNWARRTGRGELVFSK